MLWRQQKDSCWLEWALAEEHKLQDEDWITVIPYRSLLRDGFASLRRSLVSEPAELKVHGCQNQEHGFIKTPVLQCSPSLLICTGVACWSITLTTCSPTQHPVTFLRSHPSRITIFLAVKWDQVINTGTSSESGLFSSSPPPPSSRRNHNPH